MSFEKIAYRKTAEQLEKNKTTTAVTAGQLKKEYITTAVTAVPDKEIDYLINEYSDLTLTGKPMNGFYANWIRKHGAARFVQYASRARQEGKVPAKYFSWLLKNG